MQRTQELGNHVHNTFKTLSKKKIKKNAKELKTKARHRKKYQKYTYQNIFSIYKIKRSILQSVEKLQKQLFPRLGSRGHADTTGKTQRGEQQRGNDAK